MIPGFCDLKLANILFASSGAAKVADFGIAHVSGEMLTRSWVTPSGFVAGTLPYNVARAGRGTVPGLGGAVMGRNQGKHDMEGSICVTGPRVWRRKCVKFALPRITQDVP